MEQATQPTEPTAPPEARGLESDRAAYKRAWALADSIVDRLTTLPRSSAVVADLTGFQVRLNFGTNDPSGVVEFAALADTKAVRDQLGSGLWLEARSIIDDIPVCAEVLLSLEVAAVFETDTMPGPAPQDTAPTEPTPVPVPVSLSDSPVAQDQADLYDQSLNRYVASLGGSTAAQATTDEAGDDDPHTISFAPVTPAAGGGQ